MKLLRKLFRRAFSNPLKPVDENASSLVFGVAPNNENLPRSVSESSSYSVHALQKVPMPSFVADACKGMQFHATCQLRTPLRVLRRHGDQYLATDGKQPQIAHDLSEGIWLPLTKMWKELSGVELTEFTSSVASDVGPVMVADYLPFLIAFREAVEAGGTIEQRIASLEAMGVDDRWGEYVRQHGGIDSVVARFFPVFVYTVPALISDAAEELSKLGLDTPNLLADAPDDTLLAVMGIGPAKLRAIRAYCQSVTDNRDACRVDRVMR